MDRVFEFILQYGLFLGIPFDGDKKGKSGKP